MSILNAATCGNGTNTGIANCPLVPGAIVEAYAVPKGYVMPNASIATVTAFKTALNGLLISDNPNARAFRLLALQEMKDNTGEPVTETRNQTSFRVINKPYNWQFMIGVDFCAYINYKKKFDVSNYDWYFYDNKGQYWVTTADDAAGLAGAGGIAMSQVTVDDWTPPTFAALEKYVITFRILNNLTMTDNLRFIAATTPPAITGLVDVVLAKGTVGTTSATVLYVTGALGCGASSLGDTYGTTLAATSAWTVVNATTGATITVSGVAYNATTKEYALTITSTPATAVLVGIAAPSVITATPYFAYIVTEAANKAAITTP